MQGSGHGAEPGRDRAPLPDALAVTRSTVMAVPHETTSPGRPGGMSRRRREDPESTIRAAGLGPLDVFGNGNLGRRLKPGYPPTCLASRNSASCVATGGLTDEIAHHDGSWPRTADCDHASAQAAGSRGSATFSARCPAATTRAHLSRLFPRSATK